MKQHKKNKPAAIVTEAAFEKMNATSLQEDLPGKERLLQSLMDSYEVQQLLHICRGTLYNWRKKGLIAFSKVGGRIYFEVADVYQMLRERKQQKGMLAA